MPYALWLFFNSLLRSALRRRRYTTGVRAGSRQDDYSREGAVIPGTRPLRRSRTQSPEGRGENIRRDRPGGPGAVSRRRCTSRTRATHQPLRAARLRSRKRKVKCGLSIVIVSAFHQVTKRNGQVHSNAKANSSAVRGLVEFRRILVDAASRYRPARNSGGLFASSLQTCCSDVMNNFATLCRQIIQ